MYNQRKLDIFIGYDKIERVSWHTLAHSIIENSSIPISLNPVANEHYSGFFTRSIDPMQSNAFSFTRFVVPYLMDFSGYAIYMDCDMLLRADINEIVEIINSNPSKAVHVVKHNYTPKDSRKYLNTKQFAYPRKNWSSFVVWNCAHKKNQRLTPEFFNSATGLELHRFTWLDDDDIGEIDVKWNWLVGVYDTPPADVRNVHWTLGGPYFKEYSDAEFADEWFSSNRSMNYCSQRENKEESKS